MTARLRQHFFCCLCNVVLLANDNDHSGRQNGYNPKKRKKERKKKKKKKKKKKAYKSYGTACLQSARRCDTDWNALHQSYVCVKQRKYYELQSAARDNYNVRYHVSVIYKSATSMYHIVHKYPQQKNTT